MEKNDSEKNKDNKKFNKFNSFWIYGLIALVLLASQLLIDNTFSSTKDISFIEFKSFVEQGDVDRVAIPLARCCGRGDGDATFLFLLHPVHDGRAFMDLTHLVGASRVVENPLGRRGLARVDVGHDPDVANLVEGDGACHVGYQR